jgi:hypothetical protein
VEGSDASLSYLWLYRRWVIVGVAVVTALALAGINSPRFMALARNGVLVEGQVERFERENHGAVFYVYRVANLDYHGIGNLKGAESASVSAGTSIDVWYLPDSPGTSCLGDPRKRLLNELPPAIFGGALVGFAVYLFLREYRRKASREV